MKRREFLSQTSLATIGFLSFFQSSCNTGTRSTTKINSVFVDDFELNEITIRRLQEKFASGYYSSEQITLMYLKRIGEIDKNGPVLNSIIELNPDAVEIARA